MLHDLLSLHRMLETHDAPIADIHRCGVSTCECRGDGATPGCSYLDSPVLICDGQRFIRDVHRCGTGGHVERLAGLLGRSLSSVFGSVVVERIERALGSDSRVTLTAYLLDDDGAFLRTELSCWSVHEAARGSSGVIVMLHDLLAMEDFERRLGARITRLFEKNLALEGALAAHRRMSR